jgi:hypothetical protein
MATHFRFTKDFDARLHVGQIKAFKAGQIVFIPENIAEEAEKAKAGERVAKDGKGDAVEADRK